jgi:hypothetical protein
MDIINRAGLDETIVRRTAEYAVLAGRSFVLLLDDAVNAMRADFARTKLQEYRQKGWNPIPGWEQDATGENDIHACTVSRRIIAKQKLPAYAIDAIGTHDILVYLDAVWTKGPENGLVLTLAHELRHAWQYFNVPTLFHSQTPLSWVMAPQQTPCELDAERAAKRAGAYIYGEQRVQSYLANELETCKPEYRETTERLATLDPEADPQAEAKTIILLEQHAEEIRRYQREYKFEMSGIAELMDILRNRSRVQLRP